MYTMMLYSSSLVVFLVHVLSAQDAVSRPYNEGMMDDMDNNSIQHSEGVMMADGMGDDSLLFHLARKLDSLERRVDAQDRFLSVHFAEFMMLEGAVDGGWSAYSQWLPCSSTCNGKSLRFRHCDNPRPRNGGRDCVGGKVEMKPCNTQCMVSEAEIRLVGGSRPSEGRLEVLLNEQWGTVCDRNFSLSDAIVVCKNLGYPQTPEVMGGAHHGEGIGPIFFHDLMCEGMEKDIFHCPGARMDDVNMECRHDADVSIDCEPMKPKSKHDKDTALAITAARLSGGPRRTKGRLEVQVNHSRWGTVCDDHFDVKDAIVACRMLNMIQGFEPVLVKDYIATGPKGPIFVDDLKCSGQEFNLDHCRHRVIGHHSCHHYEDVGIDCQPAFNESLKAHCPPDFVEHKGFCYFFSDVKKSRAYATRLCQEMQGHLLEIRNAEENNYISQLIQSKSAQKVWLATKKNGQGDYIFDTDGRKPVYANWNTLKMDDTSAAEKECVVVTAGGEWMNEKCDILSPYVCQKYGKLRPSQYLP